MKLVIFELNINLATGITSITDDQGLDVGQASIWRRRYFHCLGALFPSIRGSQTPSRSCKDVSVISDKLSHADRLTPQQSACIIGCLSRESEPAGAVKRKHDEDVTPREPS